MPYSVPVFGGEELFCGPNDLVMGLLREQGEGLRQGMKLKRLSLKRRNEEESVGGFERRGMVISPVLL